MTDLPAIEAARLRAQARLDAERDARTRNRDGQFATPPALAQAVVAEALAALGPEPVRLLEPAMGSGAFVSALLASGAPIERLVGIELDPRFAELAAQLWGASGLELRRGDFCAMGPEPAFNLLLSNPPYVRHHHLDRDQKSRLRAAVAQATGSPPSGLMGLYGYFLLLARGWLEPGGVAVWLVPSEHLDVGYGTNVRAFLAAHWTVLRVHRADPRDPLFGDALVSSAVLVLRNAPPPEAHAVRFTAGGTLATPAIDQRVPQATLATASRWPPPPPAVGVRLGDRFVVRRGLVTGGNGTFVLSELRARDLPAQHLRPMLPPPRRLRIDEVGARPDGQPDLPDPLFLLDCADPPERVAAEHPALWAWLAAAPARVRDGYLCAARTPWYRQERRPPAPILCTYMGRGARPFRFVRNRSLAVAGNVWLCLYPRVPMDEDELDGWWRRLSALDAAALTGVGRVYGGGLHKLEPGELAELRLP